MIDGALTGFLVLSAGLFAVGLFGVTARRSILFQLLSLGRWRAVGSCNGLVPIFTLTVGQAQVALALMLDPLSALFGVTVPVPATLP